MTDKIVVLSTCETEEQAAALARSLVEQRLAACVNIIREVRSIYHWQGKIEDAREWLLVVKTRRDKFDDLRKVISNLHSYEVPEVIAMPIVDGSQPYLEWLDREVI